jgi:hypothetical protein
MMITYLAIAFTSKDPRQEQYRFEFANRAAAELMDEGKIVFSPISHSYPIHKYLIGPDDFHFWMEMDLPILRKCGELIVGDDGTKSYIHSAGVQEEIRCAEEMVIPIIIRRF